MNFDRDEKEEARVCILGTDKARYSPGETVILTAKIQTGRGEEHGKYRVLRTSVYRIGEIVCIQEEKIPTGIGDVRNAELPVVLPTTDYQGYLICLELADEDGNILDTDTIGCDVSSDWLKFPRYGYVCEFENGTDADARIREMNRYHINGIEYYDWHALHHEPLPQDIQQRDEFTWEDWAGREISGSVVKDYIRSARKHNMVSMAYNMIYAGTDSFVRDKDGRPTEYSHWMAYHYADGPDKKREPFTYHMGDSPSGNGTLYFMNPLNEQWQKYIFAKEIFALDTLGFDGWHGDTIGEQGRMTGEHGEPLGTDKQGEAIYEIKNTYRAFLNQAKAALGNRYLSFNPVGAQGMEQVNTSHTDVLYAEFWPWERNEEGKAYRDYSSIVAEIEKSTRESKPYSCDGKGKSLVVKAYVNEKISHAGTMNAPGVLLLDAVSYAAGGSRLELGNGRHMLHTAYYPDDKVLMGAKLEQAMCRMADFTVAYENLLRDGQHTTENRVEMDRYPMSRNGRAGTIWAYTRADDRYEILHLINLLGTDNEWRDVSGRKKAPAEAEGIVIRYFTGRRIGRVCVASFSENHGMSRELEFIPGESDKGRYIQFAVPHLSYWDVIYMSQV